MGRRGPPVSRVALYEGERRPGALLPAAARSTEISRLGDRRLAAEAIAENGSRR